VANNTTIGASGNGVGTSGLLLTNVAGDLSFANLVVFADNGAALSANGLTNYTGSAGFQLVVGAASTLAATGGPAASLNTVTANLPLAQITSTNSGSTGVSLTSVLGTFSAPAGSSITNATGTDFAISGGTANVTYGGTITDDIGALVTVANTTGGTKTFSGAITDGNDGDGSGISLTTNTGATINFQGGLLLSTGANPAFTATGGGTVNVCDENPCNPAATGALVNTLTTSTGTALNVANTTIGANRLEFRSISANGGTNGIILNSTGIAAGDGGLSVIGDGVNTTLGGNGSGGTIQNTTGAGIALNSTRNVTLNYMTITNPGTDGMAVTNVSGFVLNRSTISDASGTGPFDAAIDFNNYSNGDPTIVPTAVNGAVSITNSLIGPAAGSSPHNSVTAVVGSGTSDWTVSGTTIRNTGNSGINLEVRNSGVLTTFTVSGSTFAGGNVAGGTGSPSARGIFANNLEDSIVGLMKIENNTFTNNNIHIDLNQQNDTDPVGSHTFVVRGNTMTGARSQAMNVFAAAGAFGGAFTGTIQNNNIGNASVDGSGSEIGNGIRVNMNGGTDATMLIDSNDIFETPNGRGIEVIGRNGLGQLDVTITNNLVDHYNLTYPIGGGAAFPLGAIFVNAARGGATGIVGFAVRADVRFNTVPTAGGALPAASEVTGTYLALVESVGSETGGILELVDSPAGPGGQTPTQQLQSTNTGDAAANAGVSLIPGPIDVPPIVPLLFAPGGVESSPAVGTPAPPAFVGVLTQPELDSLVAAAFERWLGTGLNADQFAALRRLTFEAADLPGGYLGETSGTRIRLDHDAGGHSWFTGFGAKDDAHFVIGVATTRRYADPESAPAGRIDLLTAVMHEMGHALGLEDTYAEQDRDSVMYGFLTKGERRVPSRGQGSFANQTPSQ
jgi:hypothetical protein